MSKRKTGGPVPAPESALPAAPTTEFVITVFLTSASREWLREEALRRGVGIAVLASRLLEQRCREVWHAKDSRKRETVERVEATEAAPPEHHPRPAVVDQAVDDGGGVGVG
jgi:hypothetical protein